MSGAAQQCAWYCQSAGADGTFLHGMIGAGEGLWRPGSMLVKPGPVLCRVQDAGHLQLDGVPVPGGAARGAEAHMDGGEDEAVPWQPEHTHLYNYSIAFQPAYSVPILLFSGRKPGRMSAEVCCMPQCSPSAEPEPPVKTVATLYIHVQIAEEFPNAARDAPGLLQKRSLLRCPGLSSGADGALLSWEDMLRDLPAATQAIAGAGDGRWAFITQQEHPATRAAMHSIHPCETASLMSLLMAQDADAGPTAARSDQCCQLRNSSSNPSCAMLTTCKALALHECHLCEAALQGTPSEVNVAETQTLSWSCVASSRQSHSFLMELPHLQAASRRCGHSPMEECGAIRGRRQRSRVLCRGIAQLPFQAWIGSDADNGAQVSLRLVQHRGTGSWPCNALQALDLQCRSRQ